MNAKYFTPILCAIGVTTSFGEPHSANSSTSSSDVTEKQGSVRKVLLQIMPVGPVPLARFGSSAPPSVPVDARSQEQKEKDGATGGTGTKTATAGESGAGGFSVINEPDDERPPQILYAKVSEKAYAQLPCALNSMMAPVEIPLAGDTIGLYERERATEPGGKDQFKQVVTVQYAPGQTHAFVLIYKSSKTRKWTNPTIKVLNLSAVPSGSVTVVNASEGEPFAAKINDEVMVLRSGGVESKKGVAPGSQGVSKIVMAAGNGAGKTLPPFVDSYFPVGTEDKLLMVAYPVALIESDRGAKLVRGTIRPGSETKATLLEVKP